MISPLRNWKAKLDAYRAKQAVNLTSPPIEPNLTPHLSKEVIYSMPVAQLPQQLPPWLADISAQHPSTQWLPSQPLPSLDYGVIRYQDWMGYPANYGFGLGAGQLNEGYDHG